jgi:cell wall-associated NlpC family hydrolase
VEPNQLQAGDLLFFGKDKDNITHVGMFIGEGKFIQSSSSLGGVIVSDFNDPKFQTRFQGARRILKP